jgi:hypothetical protein
MFIQILRLTIEEQRMRGKKKSSCVPKSISVCHGVYFFFISFKNEKNKKGSNEPKIYEAKSS